MTKQTTAAQANAILDREEKAMSRIVAFALVDTATGESLGKITGSYPKDGAGNLRLWLRLPLIPPIEGKAGGGGYNKMQAALYDLGEKLGGQLPFVLLAEKENMEAGKKETAARYTYARITAAAVQAALVDQKNLSDFEKLLKAEKINLIQVI